MALQAAVGGRRSDSKSPEGRSWCATELLKHAVFADPDNTGAKETPVSVFTQLGYGAADDRWCFAGTC